MTGIIPTKPSRAEFLRFLRVIVDVPVYALPDDSIAIDYSYEAAVSIVNRQIRKAIAIQFVLAVDNLAADNLINWAPDQTGQNYFKNLRAGFGINTFTAGVVSETHDEGTGTSIEVIEAMKNLTLANLANLKTPYGRAYLGIAQAAGSLWGIS